MRISMHKIIMFSSSYIMFFHLINAFKNIVLFVACICILKKNGMIMFMTSIGDDHLFVHK